MRFIVEIAETWQGSPRTVRVGPYDTEERGRAAFERETIGTRDYYGLPADGDTDEIRLVEEIEERGAMYPRRRLVALVVKFCARCTHLGNSECAEAAAEIAERLGKTGG